MAFRGERRVKGLIPRSGPNPGIPIVAHSPLRLLFWNGSLFLRSHSAAATYTAKQIPA